jgi:ATP-dependent RNA helicase DeaD
MSKTYKDFNLSPALAAAVEELGYINPTPIQEQTLPLLLEGPTDFLGLAATGTGKTAAFGIPLLEQLNNSHREVQALVLCPTRELAIQVTEQLNLLGKHKKLRAVPIYGGAGYGDQIRGLRQGAQIVVATPGRLIDHLERGTVELDNVQTVILDEADEMISMGFKDDIESILESMPEGGYNTWLFSATMSKEVRKVADRFLSEPKTVQINKTEMLSGTVQQVFFKVREGDKVDILCKLIDSVDDFYGLIFCQTKSLVMDLTRELGGRGYKVDCLHGDKDQNQRERTMRAFKSRDVNVLVCTDVACRGLDVKDLTHVVNYSIPRELDNYVHRIGRTGRSGKAGVAWSLVTPSHMGLVGRIEKMTKSTMELGTIPTRRDIGRKKVSKLLGKFQGVQNHEHVRVEQLLDESWLQAIETMSKAEIAARLLTLTFSDIFVDHEKEKQPEKKAVMPAFGGSSRDRERPRRREEFRRYGRDARYAQRPTRDRDRPRRHRDSTDRQYRT